MRLFYKPQYRDLFLGAGLLCATAALLHWPQESMEAVREGLNLCGNVILPSLFPFCVLSALIVELGLSQYLVKLLEPVMRPLFRLNGSCACALAMGFIGGYPVGARTAINLYQNGQCTKTEAERLLAFCNNSGPAFILGVVGAGVFGSSQVGLVLYFTHVCASLLVGLLFRFYKPLDRPSRKMGAWSFHAAPFAPAFTQSVTGALTSTLNICSFILFFTVVLRCLALSGLLATLSGLLALLLAPFGLTQPWAQKFLVGLLEVSTGVSTLGGSGMLEENLSMAAFMLGWAGLSVHCQVLAFSGESGLSMKTYLVGKLLHGGLSALLTALFLGKTSFGDEVSTCLAEQAETLASLDFSRAFSISITCAFAVWVLFFALVTCMLKKRSRNTGRHAL